MATAAKVDVQLTREQARQVCVRAAQLALPRPTDALDVVRHELSVQLDFTEAVAHSHDLIVWSRLGDEADRDALDRLRGDGAIIELHGRLIAADDLALYRADLDDWPGREGERDWRWSAAEWVKANDGCRRDILDELLRNAPLSAEELPDTCEVPWKSSGWTNNKNTQRMLDHMEAGGEVAVVDRRGRTRLWDLAERVWPEVEAVPADEAALERDRRRLAAAGLLRATRALVVPDARSATIEGVRGRWLLDATQAAWLDEGGDFAGRTVIVSPLDRLVFDRKRVDDVFEFEYQLEMYKPAAARRWGYWAMPVLRGDRLIGKIDATSDRREGALFVDAVHQDSPWDRRTVADVDEQIEALATWLGLGVTRT